MCVYGCDVLLPKEMEERSGRVFSIRVLVFCLVLDGGGEKR